MSLNLILLAAGDGTRMQSALPKVLHEIAGAPMIVHALASAEGLEVDHRVLVLGNGSDAVLEALEDTDAIAVEQTERKGTAHAVLCAKDALANAHGDAVVLYGDTPFIRPETLEAMAAERAKGADVVILGFEAADPARYGRLVMDGDQLDRIVEYKDASEAERAINLCNSGVVMADCARLMELCAQVGNNNSAGEFYLTDIVALARADGKRVAVVTCNEAETMGVNSRADLAAAEAACQARARREALDAGVTLVAPETVWFSFDTVIGRDAFVEPNVFFGPGVTVESGARIKGFSHLEGAHVSEGAAVGPFARLRPGAEIGGDARVGNFVEIKNSVLAEGAKVGHLTYLGDADIGARANIGAGTVTCNYDGVFKHRTEIGQDAFIGSDTMLVAPVSVGDGAMTATGSVITKDIEAGDMAVARARQENKPGFAAAFFKRLRALKAKG